MITIASLLRRRKALKADPYSLVRARLGVEAGPNSRQVALCFSERDEVVRMRAELPTTTCGMTISTRSAGRLIPTGVTDVSFDPEAGGEVTLDQERLTFTHDGEVSWSVSADLWHTLRWQTGTAPYLRTEFDLDLRFDGPPCNTVFLLDIPVEYRPASLQGDFHLAHPSQRRGDRRIVPLFHANSDGMRIRGVVTKAHFRPDVWLNAGKGALLVFFAVIIGAFPLPSLESEKAVLLIAALAGLGLFVADAVTEFSASEIYSVASSRFKKLEAFTRPVSVITYVWITSDFFRNPDAELGTVELTAGLVVGTALLLVAAVGLYGHRAGAWQGYSCDMESCATKIPIRRGHLECYLTGRVPCPHHAAMVCANCPHHADLGSQRLTTLDLYDPEALPCRTSVDDGS